MKRLALAVVAVVFAFTPVSADAKPKPWHDHKNDGGASTHRIDWD